MKKLLIIAFLLTWTAEWQEPTICNSPPPEINPYNGELMHFGYQTLQSCYQTHHRQMRKTFDTMEELEKFQEGCEGMCHNWEIVEIKKEKT